MSSSGPTPRIRSAAYYTERKAYFADHGLTVYGFGNSDVHNQDAIVLGLPNRDAKIEEYKRHFRAARRRRHSLHHLRQHAERHLEHRAGDDPRRSRAARL